MRGKPLRVSPLAFNHPPAGDRFCAAKSPLQKRKTPSWVSFFFGAGDEARTRFPASREWHSHSQEPCLTSEFDALRAGRGSEFKPARGIPKTKPHPFGWGFVFVIAYRFCCPHSRPPQGRGSVRGKPLTGSPTRVQSPARRRPILRSKIAAPKKYDHPKGGRIFLERATRLELATSTLARSRSTR